jgi:hypothetical protein
MTPQTVTFVNSPYWPIAVGVSVSARASSVTVSPGECRWYV